MISIVSDRYCEAHLSRNMCEQCYYYESVPCCNRIEKKEEELYNKRSGYGRRLDMNNFEIDYGECNRVLVCEHVCFVDWENLDMFNSKNWYLR